MIPSTIYCDNCGTANRPQARFCITCGQPMAMTSSIPPTLPTGPTVFPAASSGPTASQPPSSSIASAQPPTSSYLLRGRYRNLGRLGQGGMGAVYKTEDVQLGNRLAAVKEMSQSGLSPQEIVAASNAFKQEAYTLAKLQHPHLPSIYDYFEEAGHWYLVMSYIQGETLEQYLRRAQGRTLPPEEVLDIGIQLCTVLDYLHTQQPPIIFRDLKPGNVMRMPNGHLYLVDFGIARHFKPGQAKDTAAYVSTGYAAPEQYGQAQTTPQSDIYSLGATLHHLLSGSDPSQTPFVFAPLPPTTPAELATLIMRMVKMEPQQRPASMVEVKQELQRMTTHLVGNQPAPSHSVSVSPPSLVPPTARMPSSAPSSQLAPSTPIPTQAASLSLGSILCTYRGHADIVWSPTPDDRRVVAVAWSPDGMRLASGSWDKTMQVWDAATGKSRFTCRGHADKITAVTWSPDGTRLASGSWDKTVQVWDATTGKSRFTYRGHTDKVTTVAWSPDGRYIASGSWDKTVQLWEAATGKSLFTYRGHAETVTSVTWSPDRLHVASGSKDKTVQIWEATTGKFTLTYGGHTEMVLSVAWSPDGTRLASGSKDKAIQVWDVATGKLILTYRGLADKASAAVRLPEISPVAWSPDGMRLASGSRDKTVQIWDASTGKEMFTYRGHAEVVDAIAWSPDGMRLASGDDDGTVQVWQAA